MADKDIFQIEVDPSGAVTGYRAAEDAQDEFFRKGEEGSSVSEFSFQKVEDAVLKVTAAIAGAAGVAAGFALAINQGSAIDDVASAFDSMTEAAGSTADVFLTKLNNATGQTISNFDIMRAANEAMRAGIKPDEFIELTEAARVLAEETGGNLTEELNQLSNAFETGRVMGLKNKLGVIDLEQANQAFADSIGIEVSELTKEQQVMIARASIMDAAVAKQAMFGAITEDAGDKIQKAVAKVNNLKDSFLQLLATSGPILSFLDDLNNTLEYLAQNTAKSNAVAFGLEIEALNKKIKSREAALKSLHDWGFKSAAATKKEREELEELRKQLALAERNYALAIDYAKKETEAKSDNAQSTSYLDRALQALERTSGQVASAIAKTTEEQNKLNDAIDEALGFDKFPALTKEIQEIMTGPWSLEYMAEKLKEAAAAFINSGGDADDFAKVLDKVKDSASKASDELAKVEEEAKAAAEAFNKQLGQEIGIGLRLIFEGDVEGGLRSIGGFLGSSAGAAIGADLGGPIGEAIGSELGRYIGEELGGAISDAIDHAFGGDHPDDEARKSVGEYFEGLFEDLDVSLIINNKLVDSLDMILTHPVNGGEAYNWPEYLGLGPDTIADFTGIGEAIRHALGFEDLPEGQLGAILATNFQDLNTLQQALQAIGMNAEQLQKGLEDAFLNGEMSAKEFLAASASVEDLFKRGIPGAIGATDQAMRNFINGALTSGRAAWDGLGDIASEAMERGISSMGELNQLLLSQGFAVEDLTKFFDVLKRHGIDSLQELANVSVEEAAAITSELEDLGFSFVPALEHADEIRDAIEGIPANTRRSLTIDVHTVGGDKGGQAILDNNLIPEIKNIGGEGRA